MSFIGELTAKLGICGGYSVINFNGEYVYVEGIERLVFVGENEISVSAKRTVITVEGEKLMMEELDGGTLIIKGKINCVSQKEM
ncbi:MAG: YabP/YqfC family sporulation protein [Clostridia bacterium]|nr:YabP/YqfC family sporulation protein [Clostridia bacterium]